MKRFNRREFVRLFAAAAASAFVAPKKAFAEENSEDLVAFSPSIAIEIADMFASNSLIPGLTAENPIPLLDLNGNQIGWSVDYTKNGNPHGYIRQKWANCLQRLGGHCIFEYVF